LFSFVEMSTPFIKRGRLSTFQVESVRFKSRSLHYKSAASGSGLLFDTNPFGWLFCFYSRMLFLRRLLFCLAFLLSENIAGHQASLALWHV